MKRRVRQTGPSAAMVDALIERAQGLCEVGGHEILGHERGRDWSAHHRLPRGRGGRNALSNLLLVCGSGTTGHHGSIESYRTGAYAAGWLVPTGMDPAAAPVMIGGHLRRWVLLTEDGRYVDTDAPAGVSA